ncbi:MAG: cytochrome c3 family protein [Candidatus Thiodiazotropha sp.]
MKLHLNMLNKSILAGMAVMMVTGSAFAGSITGSKHDMSWETWNGGDLNTQVQGQICNVCHAPHNGANAAVGPLWNHDTPTSTYTMYTSPLNTLDGAMVDTAPSGASFLCLSCHDGSVALNAFGGQTGGNNMAYIGAQYRLGSDLSNDHPIGVEYTDTSAGADGELRIPSDTNDQVIIGSGGDTKQGPVGVVMLDNATTVQCSSCHDVHNHYTSGDKFLKVTKTGSQICLACHKK